MSSRGKKVAEGKATELLNPANTLVVLETDDDERTRSYLQSTQWSNYVHQQNWNIILKMHRSQVPALNEELVKQDIKVYTLRPKHSLEDYFLSLTTANQHVDTYRH